MQLGLLSGSKRASKQETRVRRPELIRAFYLAPFSDRQQCVIFSAESVGSWEGVIYNEMQRKQIRWYCALKASGR